MGWLKIYQKITNNKNLMNDKDDVNKSHIFYTSLINIYSFINL